MGGAEWASGPHRGFFDDVPDVEHIRLAERADAIVVAPATADLLARLAGGHADDLLTTTVLATSAPVLLAPAMHTGMWQNAATVDNVATLRRHGLVVKAPATGRLTGRDSARGVYLIPTRLQNSLIFSSLCLSAPPRWPSRTLLENASSSPWVEPGKPSTLCVTSVTRRQVEWAGLSLKSPLLAGPMSTLSLPTLTSLYRQTCRLPALIAPKTLLRPWTT
ncbi:phosphopantothenoylcysteine decarboxylase [Cutibacterium acnes JCM 18916]|nr:phosphopantothenoylcysteine decarboxylase [Cutibacterium acnes JCM 18916]